MKVKSSKKQFPLKSKLIKAKVEKDVENIYRECFSSYFGTNGIQITSPFGCDGYLITISDDITSYDNQLALDLLDDGYRANSLEKLKILFEFKFDRNFNDSIERSKAIIQTIFYIKKFELEGRDLEIPNVIFIGDINEMFAIHYNSIQKYLDKDINWKIAPSNSANEYNDFVLELSLDENIKPHVVSVSDESFNEIIEYVINLNNNTQPHIRINEHNISRIFDDFIKNIIHSGVSELNPETLVGIFIGCLSNPDDYYLHPKKKNILVTPTVSELRVHSERFKAFFKFFKGENYNIDEKRKFTEIQDRLIEDLSRRRSGEYFTPTIWADESVNMISEHFGNDWKEKFVVWDCACGTKNLTRDYSFKYLFSSTLHKSDIDVSNVYNTNNISFQYDFLNDDIDELIINYSSQKLPKELLKCFEDDRPIIFFINPPYGTATSDGAKGDGSEKKGMSLTNMNKIMNNEGYGYSSQQLYTQFLARIIKIKTHFKLTKLYIALFSPPTYLSSSAFKGFRNHFFNEFKFEDAMLFSANNFADVSKNWGISFSLWSNSTEKSVKSSFTHKLKDLINGEIISIGSKEIYNTDYLVSGSDWAKSDFQKKYSKITIDYPQMSSAINIKQSGRGTFVENALGFYNNGGNNIYQSEGQVGIYSSPFSNGNGYAIMPEYFDNIITNFITRRFGFSFENWANQKDEFLKPNKEKKGYNQFQQDALILTIFNPKSKVSSLRRVLYKGNYYNIFNHFFFMSKVDMLNLSKECNNSKTYQDLLDFGLDDRFVYKKINEYNLSDTATEILNFAKELVIKSFPYRENIAEEYPEYNLDSWDAGWFQLKFLIEKISPNQLTEFEKMYNEYFNETKNSVYDFEFLYK
jgi:hypothetical protein